jgi:hypothetical protein
MSMERKYLRDALLAKLALELRTKGFSLLKLQGEFIKKTIDGWWKFQLVFLQKPYGWEIKIALLIRKNLVEDIYHKASFYEPKFQKSTATAGLFLEKIVKNNINCSFKIENENDIVISCEAILNLFTEFAEPFFIEYDSIKALDKAINIESDARIFSGPKYEGNTGIILAKLANNPKYYDLEQKYRDYYKNLSNGFYLPEYEGIVKSLNSIF